MRGGKVLLRRVWYGSDGCEARPSRCRQERWVAPCGGRGRGCACPTGPEACGERQDVARSHGLVRVGRAVCGRAGEARALPDAVTAKCASTDRLIGKRGRAAAGQRPDSSGWRAAATELRRKRAGAGRGGGRGQGGGARRGKRRPTAGANIVWPAPDSAEPKPTLRVEKRGIAPHCECNAGCLLSAAGRRREAARPVHDAR